MTRRALSQKALSLREARLVAILVTLALIALVWIAIVSPILGSFTQRAQQRTELVARLAANDRTIAAIPSLRRAAQAHDAALTQSAIAAPDTAAATGMLRDRLQAALVEAGGAFRGAEDLPPLAGRVTCRLRARLSPDQLTRFLASVQNARPALVITALTVGAEDALVTGSTSNLDVQLEASVPFVPARRG